MRRYSIKDQKEAMRERRPLFGRGARVLAGEALPADREASHEADYDAILRERRSAWSRRGGAYPDPLERDDLHHARKARGIVPSGRASVALYAAGSMSKRSAVAALAGARRKRDNAPDSPAEIILNVEVMRLVDAVDARREVVRIKAQEEARYRASLRDFPGERYLDDLDEAGAPLQIASRPPAPPPTLCDCGGCELRTFGERRVCATCGRAR